MAIEFTFYDYIDADGDGANVIKNWLNGDGKDAKAHFTNIMPQLEVSAPVVWRNYAKPMKTIKGQRWYGFQELRKLGKVNYRLIFKMEDRSVFLVACGIHKGQNFATDVSPQTASYRVAQMIDNPTKYRRKHEYN